MRRRCVLVVFLFLANVPAAYAYLDPGTGSIILQGAIAAIAVAWFTIKTYWYRILEFFGKKPPASMLDDDETTDSPDQT